MILCYLFLLYFFFHACACISLCFGPLWVFYSVDIIGKWHVRVWILGFRLVATHAWLGQMFGDAIEWYQCYVSTLRLNWEVWGTWSSLYSNCIPIAWLDWGKNRNNVKNCRENPWKKENFWQSIGLKDHCWILCCGWLRLNGLNDINGF